VTLSRRQQARVTPVQTCRLVSPTDSETWSAYHRIRRTVLFEQRGLFGQYDPDHPDEHKPGNYPKLLTRETTYIGVVRIDVEGELALLRRVAIDQPWQRQGYGRLLIALGSVRTRARRAASGVGRGSRCGGVLSEVRLSIHAIVNRERQRPHDKAASYRVTADR
jgi:GNAT superfamily N-acetyltransferase